jgi:hypothetical protein
MKASVKDLAVSFESEAVTTRDVTWGNFHVTHATYKRKFDITPLLNGLPGNKCPYPHWGILLQGRMVVDMANGKEIVNAGDFYYMEPGHSPVIDAGTELIEFTLNEDFQKMVQAVRSNFGALMKKRQDMS